MNYCLLSITFSILFSSCQTDIQTIRQITSVSNIPSETMSDAEILYSDSGKVKMKLTAMQLNRYAKDKSYIEFPK